MKKLKVKDEHTVVLMDMDTGEIEDTFHSEISNKEKDDNNETVTQSNSKEE